MKQIDAVIMAGGGAEALGQDVPYKGATVVAGKPMVEWVLDAMIAAPEIRKIVVTVPTRENLGTWAEKADEIVVTNGSFSENAIAGMEVCEPNSHVAVCTGDVPAITPTAIKEFLQKSQANLADFSWPIISEGSIMRQFPGSQRTFFKMDGNKYTGGNMMLISSAHIEKLHELGQSLFDTRKNPLKLAGIAGPRVLMQFATGLLTSKQLEKKASSVLGGKCLVVKMQNASLGADVDKLADVAVVEDVLSKRTAR